MFILLSPSQARRGARGNVGGAKPGPLRNPFKITKGRRSRECGLPGFVEVFACVGHPTSSSQALAQGASGHIGEGLFLSSERSTVIQGARKEMFVSNSPPRVLASLAMAARAASSPRASESHPSRRLFGRLSSYSESKVTMGVG